MARLLGVPIHEATFGESWLLRKTHGMSTHVHTDEALRVAPLLHMVIRHSTELVTVIFSLVVHITPTHISPFSRRTAHDHAVSLHTASSFDTTLTHTSTTKCTLSTTASPQVVVSCCVFTSCEPPATRNLSLLQRQRLQVVSTPALTS